jgi:hypothetical protein
VNSPKKGRVAQGKKIAEASKWFLGLRGVRGKRGRHESSTVSLLELMSIDDPQ